MTVCYRRAAALTGSLVVAALMLGGCNKAEKQELARLKEENASLRQANAEKDTTIQQLQTQRQQPGDLGSGITADYPPDAGGGVASDREVRLEVAGDVLFDSGSDKIKASARPELDRVVSTLRSKYRNNRIRVEGYTDSDPIRKSKWKSNEELSEARAQAVEAYLVAKGIPAARVSAIGMGSAKPRSTKKDSRRVEVVVMGAR